MTTDENLICLDGDGVLLDYHEGYRAAWRKAFGEVLDTEVEPKAFFAARRFGARWLTEAERHHLKTVGFDYQTWYEIPLLAGAREACELLVDAGYRIEVVSALPESAQLARFAGLRDQGVPVSAVHAVGYSVPGGGNPKLSTLRSLAPVAMADDYLLYLEGLLPATRRVFIRGDLEDGSNDTYTGAAPDETHTTVLDFARAWVATHRNNRSGA